MVTTEARHDVKLHSFQMFAQLMEHNGYSVRSLVEDVNRRLRKSHVQMTCKRGTIGNLRSGYRDTCKPEIAKAIAECLDVPVKALFDSRVSNVQREVQRKAA